MFWILNFPELRAKPETPKTHKTGALHPKLMSVLSTYVRLYLSFTLTSVSLPGIPMVSNYYPPSAVGFIQTSPSALHLVATWPPR